LPKIKSEFFGLLRDQNDQIHEQLVGIVHTKGLKCVSTTEFHTAWYWVVCKSLFNFFLPSSHTNLILSVYCTISNYLTATHHSQFLLTPAIIYLNFSGFWRFVGKILKIHMVTNNSKFYSTVITDSKPSCHHLFLYASHPLTPLR